LDLRVDVGYGRDTNGIYFSVNQAFWGCYKRSGFPIS
jgi:hypothetical protein